MALATHLEDTHHIALIGVIGSRPYADLADSSLAPADHRLEKPVTPPTPPSISRRLPPRLATALFRRYLRACIPTDPSRPIPLAGARPESVLDEARRTGKTSR